MSTAAVAAVCVWQSLDNPSEIIAFEVATLGQVPGSPFATESGIENPNAAAVSSNSNWLAICAPWAAQLFDLTTTPFTPGTVITTGTGTVGVAFSLDTSKLYVVSGGSKTVQIITVATQAVIGTPIPLWTDTEAVPGQNIAVFEDATGNEWGIVPAAGPFPNAPPTTSPNQVAFINFSLTTPAAVYYVTVGSGPDAVAATPNGAMAFVANYLDYTVSVVDLTPLPSSAPTVTSTPIDVAGTPYWIQINPAGTMAYVSSIDLAPLYPGGEGPYITVVTVASKTVTATITETIIGPAAGGFSPNGAVYVSATSALATLQFQVAIITVGTGTVINTIPMPWICAGAAVTAGTTTASR